MSFRTMLLILLVQERYTKLQGETAALHPPTTTVKTKLGILLRELSDDEEDTDVNNADTRDSALEDPNCPWSQDITTPSSPAPSVITVSTGETFSTPLAYTVRCVKDVFNQKAPDFHRAQALYTVFTEIASELETTSHFNAVMTRIAENLESLGCKKQPSHNDICTKEHVITCPSSPSPAPRQLKRKRFKKQQKIKDEFFSDNEFFDGLGSEPEIDLDGLFSNPDYDLSVALEEFKKCGRSADELHRFRLLYEETHSVGGACHIPYRLNNSPKSPSISLPKRQRDHNTQTHPLPTTPIAPHNTHPLPPASISALPLGALTPPHRPALSSAPKVSLPRAQTEPLPQNNSTTTIPPRAQTAPPDVSRNTLTAQRCTNKDASPSSFVKFMDVPVTMTREHIHDCLQNNRKWSTVDISNVEIFAIRNKDSNVVNVLKIKFKDDAQSTTAKRLLTMSISFGDTISRRCRPWYLSTRSN
ncbi:hypothetical protein JOM56_015253 [Amanita muscaria]